MDVTVLSLVYNHAAYLPALFAGLRVQDPDIAIQWIIINDASTDASGELLQALSRTLPPNIHITIIHHTVNVGASASRDEVVHQHIAGRYVMLLEGDDYLKPGFLKQTVTFLDKHPDYAAVHTGIDVYIEHTDTFLLNYQTRVGPTTAKKTGDEFTIPEGDIFSFLLEENFIRLCSFVVRSHIFIQIDNLHDLSFFDAGDYFIFLGIAKNHKIGYIPEALVVYRVHGKSLTNNGDVSAKTRYDNEVFAIKHQYMSQKFVDSNEDTQ